MAYIFDPIQNTFIDDEDKSLGNKLALNDDKFQELLEIPGVIRASEAPQPPEKPAVKEIELFNRFNTDNPNIKDEKADGGRVNLAAAIPIAPMAIGPMAKALGISTAGLGTMEASSKIGNYLKENPEVMNTPEFRGLALAFGLNIPGIIAPDADEIEKTRKEIQEGLKPGESKPIDEGPIVLGGSEPPKIETTETFPAELDKLPFKEEFPIQEEKLPIIFENRKAATNDLKKDFDDKSWKDTVVITGSPAKGTRKSVPQKTNVPFFEKLNTYTKKYHGGNLKSAIKEIGNIQTKPGIRNNKLESLYTSITNAANRSDFKFDSIGNVLQSDIKQSKVLLKLPDFTNRLKTNPSVLDNRIKELKIDKDVVLNRAQLQDAFGLDKSNTRQNNFFFEILKDQGVNIQNLPGGTKGILLEDAVTAIKDYAKNKSTVYESRKYSSSLKKKSSEMYKLRANVDGKDFVNLNNQINRSINNTLGKNNLYFPDSVAQAGHNPVPVGYYDKIEMLRDKKLSNKIYNIQNYTWQGKEINYEVLAQTSGKLEKALKQLDQVYGKTVTEKNIGKIEGAADDIKEYFNSAVKAAGDVSKRLPFHKEVIGELIVSVPEIGEKFNADNFEIDMSNVDKRFIIGNVDLINPNAVKYKNLSKEEKVAYGQNIINQKIEQLKEFYGPKGANYPPEIIEDLIEEFEFGSANIKGAAERKGLGFQKGGPVELSPMPRMNFSEGTKPEEGDTFAKELEYFFLNPDSELPKPQSYKETMNPIEIINDMIDPRNIPYYADVLTRSGIRVGEFATRIIPAVGKLASDLIRKPAFKVTGTGGNYIQDYGETTPFNIKGTGIFTEFLENITPTATEKAIGLDKLIEQEEQKQKDRRSTIGPKVLADTVGLGVEVTAPIFPGLKLLNSFARARNLPNDKVTQEILEKEVNKVLSERGMTRREFLQATGTGATVVMAKMLGLMDVAPKVSKVARAAPVMDNTVQGMPAWFKDAVYAIERKGILKSKGDIKGVEPDFFEITLDTKLGKKKVLMSKNDRDGEIILDWTTSYYDMDVPVTITYKPGQSGYQNFLSDPEIPQSVERYSVEVEAPQFEYKSVDVESMGPEDTNFDSSVNLDIKEEADAVVEALEDLGLGLTKKQKKDAAENFRYYNEVELSDGSGPDTMNPIDENDAFPFLDEVKRNK